MTSDDSHGFAVSDLAGNALYRLVTARRGTFLANPNDVYIGRALIRYGEFSELEWEVLDQLTPAGSNVIEVGANIGTHTVALAKKTGARGVVYAFEPQPVVFQNLCANLALSGLTNVHAVNAGCGAERAEIVFPQINYAREGNFGGLALADVPQDKGGTATVPVVRLDDAYRLDALSLIKIDVEGMEAPVIRGARGLIERHRPTLYIENDRQEKSAELISLVFELGYRAWWHLPPLFNPDNFAGDQENIYGNTVSVNMLCVPRERNANIGALREVSATTEHPLAPQSG